MELKRQDMDLERISEYLDNRLSAKEAASFKYRLENDDQLRASYETILAARSILQRSPKRRAPHNFTLSEKTARDIRRNGFIIPILRFSSAFSVAASVIIFAISILTNRTVLNPALMAAAPMAEKSASIETTALPPIIVWGYPATGMGGGGGGGAEGYGKGGGAPETFSAESPQLLGGGAQPDITTEAAPPEGTPESLTLAVPEGTSDMTPEPTLSPELLLPPASASDTQRAIPTEAPAPGSLPAITGSGPILGILPEETTNSIQTQVPLKGITKNDSRGLWIITASTLLFIGALAGITALILGRRKY